MPFAKDVRWLTPFGFSLSTFIAFSRPHEEISILACIIKASPILVLALFVWVRGVQIPSRRQVAKPVFAALLLSAAGDVFIQLKTLGLFLPGMAAFAASQFLYTMAFGWQPLDLVVGVPINLCAMGFYAFIYPYVSKDPIFAIALIFYQFLISSMLWRAIARYRNAGWNVKTHCRQGPKSTLYLMSGIIGAASFVVSDSSLAIWMFVTQFSYAQVIVMGTYYLAQLGISLSVLHPTPSRPRSSSMGSLLDNTGDKRNSLTSSGSLSAPYMDNRKRVSKDWEHFELPPIGEMDSR